RLVIRLQERRYSRPLEEHRLLESLNQTLELFERQEQPRRLEDAALNLAQSRLAIKVANDVIKAVERHHDGLSDDPGQIPEHDQVLSLVLESPRQDRAEFGSFQRRHAGNRALGAHRRLKLGRDDPTRIATIPRSW